MLTKQQAIKLKEALVIANKGSSRILSAVVASKTGKITASAHKQYSKELKVIQSIAAKAEKHLINAFATTKDVAQASKIEAVEKLLVASAELSMRAKIMARVLADADELSELPDGDAEFADLESDDTATDDIVDAEDEDIVDAEDEDIVDAEDEDIVDAEDEDIVDAEDEDIVDAEDEDIETEPVDAKRKLARKVRAKRLAKRVSAKRSFPRKISASAKLARRASATKPSLAQANRSLIEWDFIPNK